MISKITRPLILILSFQLAFGPLIGAVQEARAQAGALITTGQIAARGSTEGYTLPREHVTPEGVVIDNGPDAEEYIRATAEHANTWAEQCVTQKGGSAQVKWDAAFVLSDNIPYADMNIKNCAQEHEKLVHMIEFADELATKYGKQDELYNNKSCSECGIQPADSALKYFDKQSENPDYVPEGDKCSIGHQKAMAEEKCSAGDKIAGMFKFSCIGSILKGIKDGLVEAIKGIGNLIKMGAEAAWKGIKKGAKATWNWITRAEDKADSNIQAVSKESEESYDQYKKDPDSWLKKTGDVILNFLKEVIYVGLYERESKCMNCSEKSSLFCEIAGRAFNDVVGFTFTMGVGYGAIKTVASKLAPKLAEITAKLATKFGSVNSKLLAAAERGSKAARIASATAKGTTQAVRWIGGMPVRIVKAIGAKTVKLWTGFKNSKVFDVITKAKNAKWVGGTIDWAKRKANTFMPTRIAIKGSKWAGRGIKRYFDFDQRMFARGAGFGTDLTDLVATRGGITKFARGAQVAEELMPKLDKVNVTMKGGVTGEDITAELTSAGYRPHIGGKHGLTMKEKYRVWDMNPADLDPEMAASLKRAGIVPMERADGRLVFETPNANFKKWMTGQYDTKFDTKLGIPKGSDGKVVVEVETFKVKDLSRKEVNELKDKGAFFRTNDHPDADKLLNPNGVPPKFISRDLGGQPGMVVYVDRGEVKTVKASDLTAAEYKKLSNRKTVRFIEDGTDNPLARSEFDKKNAVIDNTRISGTEAAQIAAKKAEDGKIEEALSGSLYGVDQLDVLMNPRGYAAYATKSQKELAAKLSSTGVNSKLLEGMETAVPVQSVVTPEIKMIRGHSTEIPNSHIAVIDVDGDQKLLRYSGEQGNPEVYVYENNAGVKKAVLKKPNGESVIYDLGKNTGISGNNSILKGRQKYLEMNGLPASSGEGKVEGLVSKKNEGLLDQAMGNKINGKTVDKANMDAIIDNLKMNGKKEGTDFNIIVAADGSRTVEVKLPKDCVKDGKGFVSISELLAR